ncbi:hypothetical protein Ddc_13084 [Ditylenchus destructor]|nr:hypothetical protein Ddc_13084 [Ditylenchus destructor]
MYSLFNKRALKACSLFINIGGKVRILGMDVRGLPQRKLQDMLLRNSTGRTMMEFPPANGETVTEHGRELHPEELSHSQSQHKYSNDILYSCFVILSFDILHCDINAPLF